MSYFASNLFVSNYFASYHFAGVRKPAPVPEYVGPAGGWGGGKGLKWEELPPGVQDIDYATTGFLTARQKPSYMGGKFLDGLQKGAMEGAGKLGIRNYLEFILSDTAFMGAETAARSADTMLPWRLYADARKEISALKDKLTQANAQIHKLDQRVHSMEQRLEEQKAAAMEMSEDPEAGIVYNVSAAPELPPFEEVWQKAMASLPREESPAPPKPRFPWAELGLAAGTFLLTSYAVPEEEKTLKAVGYGASAALAIAGAAKIAENAR
jgi:hypothetical protein